VIAEESERLSAVVGEILTGAQLERGAFRSSESASIP